MIGFAVFLETKKNKKSARATLAGFGRVRPLEQRDDNVLVEVLVAVGYPDKITVWIPRLQLYITKEEIAYFGPLVRWLKSGTLRPGPRPPAPPIAEVGTSPPPR